MGVGGCGGGGGEGVMSTSGADDGGAYSMDGCGGGE